VKDARTAARLPRPAVATKDMFSTCDKIQARFAWRGTHTGPIWVAGTDDGMLRRRTSRMTKWEKIQLYRIGAYC